MVVDCLGEGVVIREESAASTLNEWLEMADSVIPCKQLAIKHTVMTVYGVEEVAGDVEGAPTPPSHCSRDAPMPRSEALVRKTRQAAGMRESNSWRGMLWHHQNIVGGWPSSPHREDARHLLQAPCRVHRS